MWEAAMKGKAPVVLLSQDLFFVPRIATAVQEAGYELTIARSGQQ